MQRREKDITNDRTSRQTKAEMARPDERGYGKKPDDNQDGRRQETLACHNSSRHTKGRGGKVRKKFIAGSPRWSPPDARRSARPRSVRVCAPR